MLAVAGRAGLLRVKMASLPVAHWLLGGHFPFTQGSPVLRALGGCQVEHLHSVPHSRVSHGRKVWASLWTTGTQNGPAPALPSSPACCPSCFDGCGQGMPSRSSRDPHGSSQTQQQGEVSQVPVQRQGAPSHSPGGAAGLCPALTRVTGYIICLVYPNTEDQQACLGPHAGAVAYTYTTGFQSTRM